VTRILLLGDCHAAWHRLLDGVATVVARDSIDLAIQVGDFGFFGQYSPAPLGGGSAYRLAVPLHVIDGNHEDHAWLAKQRRAGVLDRWATEQNLHVMPRGAVLQLDDVTIGFCGGALHADRRQEGCIDRGTTNWLTLREARTAAQAFSQAKVDLIVTHSCPHSLGVGMQGNPYLSDSVERYCTLKGHNTGPLGDCGEPGLTHLWGHLTYRPRLWTFGHFHVHHDVVVDRVRFHCLGALDGSDGRAEPIGYLLDTATWRMRPVALT
jgi:predicted phosphodiesterase